MSEPGFVVGGRYASAAGEYDVLAIEGGGIRIRYVNGFEMTLPGQGLWAQWEALVAERTGRPVAPPRDPAAGRAPAARPASAPRAATRGSAVSSGAMRSERPPKPKKGASGETGFYTAVGYLAAGCELLASVSGSNFPMFAQRYRILTGRGLVTPHDGLEIHERPTHRMGAALTVRFPAGPDALGYFDLGQGAKPEREPDTGWYAITRTELVERLLRLGFDLGTNNTPATIRDKAPEAQRTNFDRGISLRRTVRT